MDDRSNSFQDEEVYVFAVVIVQGVAFSPEIGMFYTTDFVSEARRT